MSNPRQPGLQPRRKWARAILLIALVIALGVLAIPAVIFLLKAKSDRDMLAKQAAMLKGTDYEKLSLTARALWDAHKNDIKDEVLDVSPEKPGLPAEITALNPHWIGLFKSGVDIELGGQWGHYGFETFYDDIDGGADPGRILRKDDYPSKELAPGLWYYSENGLPSKW